MKILVVDDEALLVKGIRFNLQNEGYDVITGSDGLEAVHDIHGKRVKEINRQKCNSRNQKEQQAFFTFINVN